MYDFLLTLLAFWCSLLIIPLLLQSYIVLRLFNYVYVGCVSALNPDLHFVRYTTVRSLLDTHRNQGILSVLLCVRGGANPEAVKRHLQEVVQRRSKFGDLIFPRLKHSLTTRCGIYAWQQGRFDLNQHVITAPSNHRGRPVSEINIQDCVSQIMSKYLPSGIPPWQITIIPTTDDLHYILLKMHHMLLHEGLNVADLLPLIPSIRQGASATSNPSPLVKVFKPPQSIPLLKERLMEDLTNKWNEFIFNYDPLERPEILKNGPGIYQFFAILLISTVAAFRECKKGFGYIKEDPFSRLKYAWNTFKHETNKRQASVGNFFKAFLITADPRNVTMTAFKSAWFLCVTFTLKLPVLLYHEIAAFYSCLILKYNAHPHTFIGNIYSYVPLFYYAIKELGYYLKILFKAPLTILQEIFFKSETFQTVTLCGRKVVAWSEAIKTENLRAIAKKTNISETEVALAATSAGISQYLIHVVKESIPNSLPITAINVGSNFIFASGPNVKPADSISGILCLTLTSLQSEKNILQVLNEVHANFLEATEKQALVSLLSLLEIRSGILSKLLPYTFLSVLLKYLSRKYAISFTEVTSRSPNVTQRTLWGQEVLSAIYWRPPQANISISLCLNEYADHVRLGVMCDAQLGPNHPRLVRAFPEHIRDLAATLGVQIM